MKQTSKKLLLWLYPIAELQHRRRVDYQQIQLILPKLTEDGRQSLIRLLESKELLFTDRLSTQLSLSISTYGKSLLEAQFPVLTQPADTTTKQWGLILFMQAPNTDKNFRYLRNFLLADHCLALTRGTYLCVGKPSDSLLSLLEKSYRGAVLIVQFDNLLFGDELKIIGLKFGIESLVKSYSDIGKDIDSLLTKKINYKSLSDQQKRSIYSVYDRLFTNLELDHNLINRYFPQEKSGIFLLNQLKSLFP